MYFSNCISAINKMTAGSQNFYLFKTQSRTYGINFSGKFAQSENRRHRGAISNELCTSGKNSANMKVKI